MGHLQRLSNWNVRSAITRRRTAQVPEAIRYFARAKAQSNQPNFYSNVLQYLESLEISGIESELAQGVSMLNVSPNSEEQLRQLRRTFHKKFSLIDVPVPVPLLAALVPAPREVNPAAAETEPPADSPVDECEVVSAPQLPQHEAPPGAPMEPEEQGVRRGVKREAFRLEVAASDRSTSTQANIQPPAAEPRDDELPEELRRNFRNALQPLTTLIPCEIIGDRKGYALTRFGEIIAEQALSKWSSEPTNGAHGDTFREGRRGAYYLFSIVKTNSSKVATAVEMFLDHAGPARTYLCNLFAGAVSDAPWAQGGKVAVCSLVPYGKECSEDGDAYCAVHKSKCRDVPDGCIAHRHFALCEAVVEKVQNAVHLEALLSYDPSLTRPGFRASEPEVKRFYDTYLPDVDVDALQDLDDRTTLLVTAPYFLEYKEIEAAIKALKKVIVEKKLQITVVFAAVWNSTSASGAPDNSSLSHFSVMTWPSWLGRSARNRHRHAIEQASRRWRGGRRDDSARTRRKILISTEPRLCGREAHLA